MSYLIKVIERRSIRGIISDALGFVCLGGLFIALPMVALGLGLV